MAIWSEKHPQDREGQLSCQLSMNAGHPHLRNSPMIRDKELKKSHENKIMSTGGWSGQYGARSLSLCERSDGWVPVFLLSISGFSFLVRLLLRRVFKSVMVEKQTPSLELLVSFVII
jgi:hypothetical protein